MIAFPIFLCLSLFILCQIRPTVECPVSPCDIVCHHGFKTDIDGCQLCECLPCPTLSCLSYTNCTLGHAVDPITNCLICDCKLCPTDLPCLLNSNCNFGHNTNEQGCPICSCRPCIKLPCLDDTDCEHGHVLNRRGCPTCTCNPCPILECFAVTHCKYGRILNNKGCPTCQCIDP